MFEFPQRPCLVLADALARQGKLLADFLQRVVGVHADAEAHAQHTFFARHEKSEHARSGFAQTVSPRRSVGSRSCLR
jgi:hypothetical protein